MTGTKLLFPAQLKYDTYHFWILPNVQDRHYLSSGQNGP